MFGTEQIAKYVEDKICDYGAGALMNIVSGSPLGTALAAMSRVSDFIESDGMSELDRIATGEIRQLTRPLRFKFKGQDLLKKVQNTFSQSTSRRKTVWQRGDWASSRQDWLTNAWQHDWRSQPRNPAGGPQRWSGAWKVGRLPYPVLTATRVGKGKVRTSRRLRLRNKYRRIGRKIARSAVSSWSTDGH